MSTHRCPVKGCKTQVRRSYLMCGYHWRLVPRGLGRDLYDAWDNGNGYGSHEHTDAMAACIEAVDRHLAQGRP